MRKVAVITQPLLNNYGGLIQNYAIQKILKNFNCDVITIDNKRNVTLSIRQIINSWIKTVICLCIGKKRKFLRYSNKGKRNSQMEQFVASYIKKSPECMSYTNDFLLKNGIDTVVVGSDQVWRPKYNYRIMDMFLDFCKEQKNIKRIAYAVSFGVDEWEYSPKQTKVCTALAKKFDAISVREESGVKLCKEHLGVEATWVLDPTLLLKEEDYCVLCKDVPQSNERFIAAYILNLNDSVRSQCECLASEKGLILKIFSADSKSTLTVPEWLAMFRDAAYVVTDSFHGTVFSIIFGKEFKCLYNKCRGSARFDSLLKLYESGKLDEMREYSLKWLKKALES